jgi:hypothetical protein
MRIIIETMEQPVVVTDRAGGSPGGRPVAALPGEPPASHGSGEGTSGGEAVDAGPPPAELLAAMQDRTPSPLEPASRDLDAGSPAGAAAAR